MNVLMAALPHLEDKAAAYGTHGKEYPNISTPERTKCRDLARFI